MKPDSAAAEYIKYVLNNNRTPNTLICYKHALRWFVRALPNADFAQIQDEDIVGAWFELASAPELCPNTIRLYRTIMATWLDWCVLHAGLPSHNLRAVKLPKKTTSHRPKVTRQRLYALRDACAKLESDYERLRALALMEVFWSSLARRFEVMSLRVWHVRLEEDPPKIFIECGKGGWTGYISISDKAAATLREWLVARSHEDNGGDPPHDWLWCNLGLKRLQMGQRAVYSLMARLADIAGISVEECKPHAMRRGSSTAMVQAGIDLGRVMLKLRHKSVLTTMEYVEANAIQLNEVRNWMEDEERKEELTRLEEARAAEREAVTGAKEAAAAALEQQRSSHHRDVVARDQVAREPRRSAWRRQKPEE